MGLAYGNPEVRKQIGIKKKDARDFAKTKHAGLPEKVNEMFDDLLSDPLEELFDLFEAEVVAKPDLKDPFPSGYAGPNQGAKEHPVTQRRNQVDTLIGTGMTPVQAHQDVYGQVNTGDTESKAALASTLGRVQDDGNKRAITIEKEKKSILALDAKLDKVLDQVTRDDLRTPMNQQVPDRDQKPVDQVAEELEIQDEYDYNEDVSYLQKYGRA